MKKNTDINQQSSKGMAKPKKNGPSKKNTGSAVTDMPAATQSVRSKPGRGLANEGTVTSYDEER